MSSIAGLVQRSLLREQGRCPLLTKAQTGYELASAAHVLGRMVAPSELASGVRFLDFYEAIFIHGAEMLLDGGYTAR